MSVRTFLDTNVLVYLFDSKEPAKQSVAQGILARQRQDLELVLSTQVLQEFYVTVTRKLATPLSPREALSVLGDLLHFSTVQVDVPLVLAAASLSDHHQVSFWDALIIEAAASADCRILLTEDLHNGREIRGLRIENPF